MIIDGRDFVDFFYISTRAFAQWSWAHVILSRSVFGTVRSPKQSKSSVNKSHRHLQNFDYILLMYTSSSHMISLKKPFIFVRSVQSSLFHFSFSANFVCYFIIFIDIFSFFFFSSFFVYAKCQRKHSALLRVCVSFFFSQSLALYIGFGQASNGCTTAFACLDIFTINWLSSYLIS